MKRSTVRKRLPKKRSPIRWLTSIFLTIVIGSVIAAGLALAVFYIELDRSLPSTQSLKNYHPPLVSSVYAADGSLIGEFYLERRYLVPLKDVPPYLVKAFLAAEDARFYEHGGVDLIGIVRASLRNLEAGEIVQGASTITQQVVKSLLLTPEKTWMRKMKEAVLAYRIDHSLTKDEILYLYLNQIYFGAGAYGVEAAARTYFDKHVGELSLAQTAMLAGLPKAPSRFSPIHNYSVARDRQEYVLKRMAEVGFITSDQAKTALAEQLRLSKPKVWTLKSLNSFTEEVRRQLEARYGREGLYKEGMSIYTTLDVRAQETAQKALDIGLRDLDKRHSRYRGVNLNVPKEDWQSTLRILAEKNGELTHGQVVPALITSYDPKTRVCEVQLGNSSGKLPPSGWEWTQISDKRATRIFRIGDVIRVRLDKLQDDKTWLTILEQDPGMEGAFLAMVPETGRVLCMVGGRDFERSQFNRATQAIRQPGSAFKPVIYAAALDKGYNEASILIDSPLVLDDHSLKGPWKPANYDHQFWGPILLRRALIHSRNVVTVKLLSQIGVNYTVNYARLLGIKSTLTPTLALALGASGVSLEELVTAYSPFVNQGERVEPYLIEKVLDRKGRLLEEHQVVRESVISPQTAYIMTHLLQGVIEEGTGQKARELGRPAAGKTGTTNEMKDAWFVGYTPSTMAGVWVGYDDHTLSLGKGETGGRAACPIWLYFMKEWLKNEPIEAFPIPPDVVFAKVNASSGIVTRADDPSGVYAAFSGGPPSGASQYGELGDRPDSHSSPGSGSESFFKSDLF
jgi:penicillin-binding protein 1A